MAEEVSYVLTTPYTLAKSRTGGVVSRLLSRVDLELIATRVFTPDEKTVRAFAESFLKHENPDQPGSARLLRDYVLSHMTPSGGRAHRVAIFLFRGENAVKQLCDIVGALYPENRSFESITGETIRDTYADLVTDDDGKITYFEPAVLTPHSLEEATHNLRVFTDFTEGRDNVVRNMVYPDPEKIQQTLVILKPDNWRFRSSRPGSIIDMFSRTGLRIVALKLYRMSVNEALEFYGPVLGALEKKLAPAITKKAADLLEQEFNLDLDDQSRRGLSGSFGLAYARAQHSKIVEFMSGLRPEGVPLEERDLPGTVKSLLIVYEGESAIDKIREVLGPTDPSQAPGGTIRRDFGSDVMVNTAHASDSPEAAEREFKIVKIHENDFSKIARSYGEG